MPLLNLPPEEWYCPNGCGVSEVTAPLPPGSSRFHTCARLHMLTAPLVRKGMDCKVEAIEREDFLGDEIQNKGDDGKPYMAIQTTHADGHTDLAVNAGLAQVRGDAR